MRMDLQDTRGAILLAVECIGSDDWLECIDGNVRTMCGSRTGGWSLTCVMSD
jgi:hypothetical protein